MTSPDVALSKDSLVLVTGANGYIGSHVVDQLLNAGYKVRGTIRSRKPWLEELFEKKYGKGRFETTIVPAMEAPGAFDEAAKDVAGVVHVVWSLSLRGQRLTWGDTPSGSIFSRRDKKMLTPMPSISRPLMCLLGLTQRLSSPSQ